MNRKGMTMESAIVVLILFGLVFIVAAFIYKSVYGFGEKQFTEKECQASLQLSKLSIKPSCVIESQSVLPLKCTRRFITVDEGKVYDTSEKKTVVTYKYDASCPHGVTKNGDCLPESVVAQEMAQCWHTFFEGEQAVFQQVEESSYKIFTSKDTKRACFICSEVTLKKDANALGPYLKNTQTVLYLSKKEASIAKMPTYYDYFTNKRSYCGKNVLEEFGGDNCFEAISHEYSSWWPWNYDRPSNDQNSLAAKKYAIVFMRQGMSTCAKDNAGDKGSYTDDDLAHTVQAVPADKIDEVCDVVMS